MQTFVDYLRAHKWADRLYHVVLYFAVMEVLILALGRHFGILATAVLISTYHDWLEALIRKILGYK